MLVAAALGSLVGIEGQRLEWAAGLRTNMLVCLGSALTMIVSVAINPLKKGSIVLVHKMRYI